MQINFENQVAIVTGAGNGLGRSHALELARRGAKVLVNDLGASASENSPAAKEVVAMIKAAGGEAMAHGANVAKFDEVEDMIRKTMERWGRVDILINNAGVLRDKTFSKMGLDDFKFVLDVHVMGTVNCCKAVWDIMREQNYGRIVVTSSSSGMYGSFGQTNYGAAKMAVLGLMNTLVLEGAKNDIRVNALAPVAGTQMTKDLMPDEVFKLLTPESVTAGALTLCHRDAPNKMILCAGAGGYSRAQLFETDGIYLAQENQNPETILQNWDDLCDENGQKALVQGHNQIQKFIEKALAYIKKHS